jgi:hypothetical protein
VGTHPSGPHFGHAAGGAPEARLAPGTTDLFADKCQSFLDNVIAGLGRIGSWNIGSQGRPGRSVTARIYEFAMDRLWKIELQKLADETGLVIRVHHYPPGTSKWNKIEHRLFCHITLNWRGRPDRLAVVELIGATTTKTGLKVESALDTRSYQKGIKVRKADMKYLDITGDQFHPEWNYTISPRQLSKP